MLTALIVAAVVGQSQPPEKPISADDITRRLRQLTSDPDKEKRSVAAAWFEYYAKSTLVVEALPELEKVAMSKDDPIVRGASVRALVVIATKHGKPIPQVVFDSLYDDELEHWATSGFERCQAVPPDAIKKLVVYAKSDKPSRRASGLYLLAKCAPRDSTALKVILAARDDPDFSVRYAAQVSFFNATGELESFFPYALRFIYDTAQLDDQPPDAPQADRDERATRNLMVLGLAIMMHEWTEVQPANVRDQLATALMSQDVITRRAAVRQIRGLAAGLLEPPTKEEREYYLPRTGKKSDPKKQRDGMKLIVNSDKIRKQLNELATTDPDDIVRHTSAQTLERLKKLDDGK